MPWGGFNGSVQRTVEAYDIDQPLGLPIPVERARTRAWWPVFPSPVEFGGGAAGTVSGSQDSCLYSVGGYNGTAGISTNEAYDPATNTWASSDSGGACANGAVIACVPTARSSPGSAGATCPGQSDSCVYVVGGASSP